MITYVIPCHNEGPVVETLYDRLTSAAEAIGEPFDVILVDDGSQDDTWERAASIQTRDPRWKVLKLARNFGHQAALSAGFSYATGDAVVALDADLQDPPEVVGQFVEKWRQGFDVVYGVRRRRKEGPLMRFCYAAFYRLLAAGSNTAIPLDAGDFCLIDRKVVDLLNQMPEQNQFVRGLRAWVGFRQIGIEYERERRLAGDSSYSARRLVQLGLDGILSFSTVPLRVVTSLGFIVSVVAFAGIVFTFLQRIFAEQFAQIGLRPVPGFATTVIAMLFLGGVQLLCLGIVGEYVGRIYDEVKRRPRWIVQSQLGFDSKTHGRAVR